MFTKQHHKAINKILVEAMQTSIDFYAFMQQNDYRIAVEQITKAFAEMLKEDNEKFDELEFCKGLS